MAFKGGFNIKKLNYFIIIISIFELLWFSNVIAQPISEGDNILVENENIAFSITGNQNVPMYSFWLPSQIENKYQVKFILLFEIIDVNQDGMFDHINDTQVPNSTVALPSLSWIFSDIEIVDNTTHFNITGQNGDFTIQFRNHLGTDASLKFDIAIENYNFISDSDDALLVLGFHLNAEVDSQKEVEQSRNRIHFGENGYFETEPTAEASGETIDVGVSQEYDTGQKIAYIAFERFTGTLIHDPRFGIESKDVLGDNLIYLYIIIIFLGIVLVISFSLIMTKKEYREFIFNRIVSFDKQNHNLTIEEVMENKNRDKIIESILKNPGCHFNELARDTEIYSGNLVWHLDVLESYKIIKNKRIGRYVTYFPYYDKNPITKVDFLIQKSTTTIRILDLINKYPGMYQNQIARKMKLNHKTVKYHLQKLKDAEIINEKKIGRRLCFFANRTLKNGESKSQ